VSVKSRLRRLEAGVHWLETEGVFVRLQLAAKLHGMLQEMSDHAAAHPDVAAQWKKIRHILPPPRVKVRPPRVRPILRDAPLRGAPQDEGVRVDVPKPAPPHPEERPERPRLEGCEPARPPPSPHPPKPRWTKDIRPGPHDVLTWDEVLQVPWVNEMSEDDES
jgi:hypothetical protein